MALPCPCSRRKLQEKKQGQQASDMHGILSYPCPSLANHPALHRHATLRCRDIGYGNAMIEGGRWYSLLLFHRVHFEIKPFGSKPESDEVEVKRKFVLHPQQSSVSTRSILKTESSQLMTKMQCFNAFSRIDSENQSINQSTNQASPGSMRSNRKAPCCTHKVLETQWQQFDPKRSHSWFCCPPWCMTAHDYCGHAKLTLQRTVPYPVFPQICLHNTDLLQNVIVWVRCTCIAGNGT